MVIQIILGMESQQLEKAVYEAIIRIRKINKKRPHEKNILTEASKASGLVLEHLRETLFSLVNAGNIRVVKTMQGNDSYFISNIDDSEDLVGLELESQADTSSDVNELVDLDIPTPHAELAHKTEASSIEKTGFLTFLDIIGKLTEDVRGLQIKFEESAKKMKNCF